ncbi:right-handed parallel beta-helix repeat-containing protein [Cohnella phaseoli]|nr:right-handed parallel beta-helix repeat-containing protein [Cohnella phaseoli]
MSVRFIKESFVRMMGCMLALWLVTANFPGAVPSVAASGGQTYYVSSSTGDDDNSGLSSSSPWKTLSKVSSVTFMPGDEILLLGGDVWNDEELTLRGSGQSGQPIVLTSYGTGRPKIRHLTEGVPTVLLRNESHWAIRGLEIEVDAPSSLTGGGLQGAGIAIEFDESRGETAYSGITIDDNLIYGSTVDSLVDGIVVLAYGNKENIDREMSNDLTIANNTIHDVGKFGIRTDTWKLGGGGAMSSSAIYRNVKIHNNYVYNIGLTPVMMNNANHSSMKWNLIHDGGKYSGTGAWTTPGGIWPIQSSYIEMKFNEVYNMSDSNTGADATGVNIDWSNEYVTAQYNYVHNNEGNGISTMSNINAKIINNRIEGNKAIKNLGNGQIGLTAFRSTTSPLQGLVNLEMSDNLIIVDQPHTSAISTTQETSGDWSGNRIHRNRIVLQNGVTDTAAYFFKSNAMMESIDSQQIFSASGQQFKATVVDVAPEPDVTTIYSTLASWQSATGFDVQSQLLPLDVTAPGGPSSLSASASVDGRSIDLSWSQASDSGSGIAHYNIYRSTDPNFTPAYRNMVGESSTTSFSDTEELLPSTHYYYKVEAEDRNGNVSTFYASDDVTSGVPGFEPLRVYQASQDFGAIRQGPVWSYQYWEGTTYSNLTAYYNPWNMWRDGTTFLTVGKYEQSPDARDAVRTWTAPFAGTIIVTANGRIAASNSEDGVLVKMMHESSQVWPTSGWQTVTSSTPADFPDQSLSVAKGDRLHFIVNRNGNNFGDTTAWDPIVTYTDWVIPTPQAHPAAKMKLVSPILEQRQRIDFENGGSEAFTIVGNGNWSIASGDTQVFRQSSSNWTSALIGSGKWEDYIVEAAIKPTSFNAATGGSVGFNLNYQDNGDRYIVSLYSGNQLLIEKAKNGSKTTLFSKYFPVAANSVYELKAEVYRDAWRGDLAIGVYVNGRKEAIAYDSFSILPSGKVGIDSWETAADFDNVALFTKANSWVDQQDVLLYDNFEDGSTSRFNVESGTWSVGTTEQSRQLRNSGNTNARIFTGSAEWADYVAQANMTIAGTDGGGGSAQMQFRYTDANNAYTAELSSQGYIEMSKHVAGTKTVLASKPYGIAIGRSYQVKVFASSDRIDLYIDGRKELAVTDSDMADGKVAFQSTNAAIYIDEVAVQKLESLSHIALFSDDFENGSSQWTVSSGTWSVVEDRTKEYQVSSGGSAHNVSGSWADAEIRAKVTMLSAASSGGFANVAFRYTDDQNKYFVSLSDLGVVELKKIVGGVQTSLASKSYNVSLQSEYRLRILAEGATIVVYLNGDQVLTATDASFSSGKIALDAYNATATFDDVSVYGL